MLSGTLLAERERRECTWLMLNNKHRNALAQTHP